MHAPELILLDKPTLGLDVLSKQHMIEMLAQLNREKGTTILVTSHDMDDLMRMARRVVMIHRGRMAYDGDFHELVEKSGALRNITVTSPHPVQIAGAKLIRQEGSRYIFEADTRQASMKRIMQELTQTEEIEDFESGQAPLEDVIARLYESWEG